MRTSICLVLSVAAAISLTTLSAAAETRLALLIGNADYPREVGRLHRTHDDVRTLARALASVGFSVDTQFDLSGLELNDALDRFERRIVAAKRNGEEAVAFFYYSGHGASTFDDGRRQNFLLPAKTLIETRGQLVRRGISLESVIRGLATTQADAIFVVSDACRSELEPAFERGEKGWAPVQARQGMFIANATSPGATAPDDGVFAEALARRVVEPNRFAERAFTLAFRDVAAQRGDYRLPTLAPALSKDFCFNGCPTDPPSDAENLRSPQTGSEGEDGAATKLSANSDQTDNEAAKRAWERIRDSRLASDFEAFLSQFPSAPEANAAREALAALKSDFEAAQRELRRLGLYHGAIDGVFGNRSIGALEAFERQEDLTQDGILQKEDLAALKKAQRQRSKPSEVLVPTPSAAAAGRPDPPRVAGAESGESRTKPLFPQVISAVLTHGETSCSIQLAHTGDGPRGTRKYSTETRCGDGSVLVYLTFQTSGVVDYGRSTITFRGQLGIALQGDRSAVRSSVPIDGSVVRIALH